MKSIPFLIAILSFGFISFAQQNTINIAMPEMIWLFKGFDAKIQVFSKRKTKRYKLECVGCNKVKMINSKPSEWIISSNESDSVVLRIKNGFGKIIHQKTIPVFDLPEPNLYMDNLDAQNVIKKAPEIISVKHQVWVPLMVNFSIISWNCTIDNQFFSGNGKKISDEVRNAMSISKSGHISFEVNYHDPFGLKKMKGIWEFNLN